MLLPLVPRDFKRYVEPFAGSACLFFALRPVSAVLGDINGELLNAYAVIKSHPRLLYRAAAALPATDSFYYRIRAERPADPVAAAARFVYLNRYCFNGVYRTNREGGFNVPRGTHTGGLPSEADFYRCSVALRGARLANSDFEAVVARCRRGDLFYLDPPYALTSRYRGEYGYGSFAAEDVPRLVASLRTIDRVGAHFIFSYSDTPLLRAQIPPGWRVMEISVRRHVAGFAGARGRAGELVVTNIGVSR